MASAAFSKVRWKNSFEETMALLLMIKRSTTLNSIFRYNSDLGSNLVIFRMDDVRRCYCSAGQLAVMDLFVAKGQNICLGLEMKSISEDKPLIEKILQGDNKGLFELCLHGWAHEDYSKLELIEQENLLHRCNAEMQNLFGRVSNVFIPPYNRFNNHTLSAMSKLGIEIISAATYTDKQFLAYRSRNLDTFSSIDHLPETTTFEIFRGDKAYRVPNRRILQDVDRSLRKYGCAVITLHPLSFMKLECGKYTQSLDDTQLEDLSLLVESLISKTISITTYSKIIETQFEIVAR